MPASNLIHECVDRIHAAAAAYDRERAAEAVHTLVAHLASNDDLFPCDEAESLLLALRDKRFFDLLEQAADALIADGQSASVVRKLHVQALIDQRKYTAADALLRRAIAEGKDPSHVADAHGLLGRIAKDQHLTYGSDTMASEERLRAAFETYARPFRADSDLLSHGINAVALQRRAEQLGVTIRNGLDTDQVAQDIVDSIDMEDPSADPRDFSTAAEAHLALGHYNEALAYTVEYVHRSNADAFAIANTLRQFVEVWELTELDAPGRRIIPFLQAELLQREGGRVDLHRGASNATGLRQLVDDELYEAVLGKESYQHLQFLEIGLRRAESIASVHDIIDRRFGTAFVVDPASFDLDPRLDLAAGECLLLTSPDVVGDATGALHIDDARMSFERTPDALPYRIASIVSASSTDQPDFVLARTEPPLIGREPIPVASRAPRPGSRVFAIGHRDGGPLQTSLFDSELLGTEAQHLFYRTSTAPGSSGSPLMDNSWHLIGLHQTGRSLFRAAPDAHDVPANRGIRIDPVTNESHEIDLRETVAAT